MTDPRRAWLTIDDQGIPQGLTWALYLEPSQVDWDDPRHPKNIAAVPLKQAISQCCALTAAQFAAGWTATPTEMRAAPEILQGQLHLATLNGRKLACHGTEFDLDDRGRARGPGMNPHAPDPAIVDSVELAAHVEARGEDLRLVERGTGKRVLVSATVLPHGPPSDTAEIVLDRSGRRRG